jgi:methionyl-tRNA formyltransferase
MRQLGFFFDHEIGNKLLKSLIIKDNLIELIKFGVTTKKNYSENKWIVELFEKFGLKLYVFEEDFTLTDKFKAEKILLISWRYLLDVKTLEFYNYAVYNIHYSLLPKYRGSYPVNQAISNGELETGFTIHRINSEIDLGSIHFQKKMQIFIDDNAETCLLRLNDLVLANRSTIIGSLFEESSMEIIDDCSVPVKTKGEIVRSREIILTEQKTVVDIINLIRGSTFPSLNVFPYFHDVNTGKVFLIKMQIVLNENE